MNGSLKEIVGTVIDANISQIANPIAHDIIDFRNSRMRTKYPTGTNQISSPFAEHRRGASLFSSSVEVYVRDNSITTPRTETSTSMMEMMQTEH